MEITTEQYETISELFPRHRGNVILDNLAVLNAILYTLETDVSGDVFRKSLAIGIQFIRE